MTGTFLKEGVCFFGYFALYILNFEFIFVSLVRYIDLN